MKGSWVLGATERLIWSDQGVGTLLICCVSPLMGGHGRCRRFARRFYEVAGTVGRFC